MSIIQSTYFVDSVKVLFYSYKHCSQVTSFITVGYTSCKVIKIDPCKYYIKRSIFRDYVLKPLHLNLNVFQCLLIELSTNIYYKERYLTQDRESSQCKFEHNITQLQSKLQLVSYNVSGFLHRFGYNSFEITDTKYIKVNAKNLTNNRQRQTMT